jgi:hypothetical protein
MDERVKRNALIVGAIVLALLSIGAGALIALSSDDDRAESPGSTPSSTSTPSPTDEPSSTPEPSEAETPAPPESESPILEDGHHFVFVKRALYPPDGSPRVRFDLAYFLTGTQGEQAAEDHGDEFVNGYYVVNDNPRLRTLPLAEDVEVEYIPATQCCELQPGDIDTWLESIRETNQTDYDGKDVPWWLTVEGGKITRIEQQYLP